MQQDNTTLNRKVALRISLLKRLPVPPVILETHGGLGRVWERVYPNVRAGAVFELDQAKAEHLCRQRPTWSVYQGKAEDAIVDGAVGHLPVTLLDVDPYGEPWPVLEAFFSSERPRAQLLGVAVNDGLRQKLRLQGGWAVRSMRQAVEKWGNATLHERYLEVCRWKVEQLAARQDYRLTHWTAYHCGYGDDMTHYAAVLERKPPRAQRSAASVQRSRPPVQRSTHSAERSAKKKPADKAG